MKGFVLISLSVLLLATHLANSRSIGHDQNLVSEGGGGGGGGGSFLPWRLSETSVTCDATYGFLPCSDNVFGLLFLILVYEILLSIGAQYVDDGSNLFFQIIGPGVVGGSVFQMLGTIPNLVMVLVPSFTNSETAAQERATTGMGMVLGGVALNLTLVWGLTIVFGSYDPSDAATADTSESQKPTTVKGSAVVTDVQTSWTARLLLVTSVPFLILELQNFITSASGKRVIILIALIITVLLLCAYILYQSFEPWIQNRCFEYVIDKYAKDKLLKLITTNGKPDARKIQRLFNKMAKGDSATVTAAEIRSLILGVKMDDDDLNAELVLEEITTYFDISGDGGIDQTEFINGITRLALTLLDETPTQTTNTGNNNSQITSQDQQPLLASSMSTSTSTSQTATNSWSIFLRASFFLVFGTFVASALSEPLVKSFIELSTVTNMSSFTSSYLFLPLSLGYNSILQSITSASKKTQRTTSLTLSSLYGGVFMRNIVGLMPYLAPVYFRNLTTEVSTELHLVLLICVSMGIYTSFNTTFPRWTGYIAICLYPISIAITYILTSVL